MTERERAATALHLAELELERAARVSHLNGGVRDRGYAGYVGTEKRQTPKPISPL